MKPLIDLLKNKEPLAPPPIWMMRQAGRYLPEYRALRAEAGGFLEMVYNPDRACEITLQPIRRFAMDGAILFSDILIVPHALGQHLEFQPGIGPILNPVKTRQDFDALSEAYAKKPDNEKFENIYKTVAKLRVAISDEKHDNTALIGFAGSPWTVACYMIEGRGKTDFPNTRQFAKENPEDFGRLIDIICEATYDYLVGQAQAGAQALKVFDSWAGLLDDDGFERWCIKPTQNLFQKLRKTCPDVPLIGFPKTSNTTHIKEYAHINGLDGIGLSHEVDINFANELPSTVVTQGNLSPDLLLEGGDNLNKAVDKILDVTQNRPHIFNLGHGVIKETNPEHVAQVVDRIRST